MSMRAAPILMQQNFNEMEDIFMKLFRYDFWEDETDETQEVFKRMPFLTFPISWLVREVKDWTFQCPLILKDPWAEN